MPIADTLMARMSYVVLPIQRAVHMMRWDPERPERAVSSGGRRPREGQNLPLLDCGR
jgi:hypothetical protein